MVLEITLQRLLFLVVRYSFWGCAIGLFPHFLLSVIEKDKLAAKIYIAIILVCLSIFLILGLFSSRIH